MKPWTIPAVSLQKRDVENLKIQGEIQMIKNVIASLIQNMNIFPGQIVVQESTLWDGTSWRSL